MKVTKDKGITLISLVITIIVMLILVGVSVVVSINGGLISTTQNAADGTENARIEEEIRTIAFTYLEGNEIKDEETLEKLKEKIQNIKGIEPVVTDINSNYPVVVKSKSNKKWAIDKKGKVVDYENIISFVIKIYNKDGSGDIIEERTYYADDGMTFKEWIDKYHPEGISYIGNGNIYLHIGNDEYYLSSSTLEVTNMNDRINPSNNYDFSYNEKYEVPKTPEEPALIEAETEEAMDIVEGEN